MDRPQGASRRQTLHLSDPKLTLYLFCVVEKSGWVYNWSWLFVDLRLGDLVIEWSVMLLKLHKFSDAFEVGQVCIIGGESELIMDSVKTYR